MAIKIGSRCSDVLTGTDGTDIIIARSGDDTVYGGDGDDWIFGGSGDDVLYGGDGDDKIFGGSGDDELHGDAGDDFIVAGSGDDTIYDGTGDDFMTGNQGDDTFYISSGQDTAYGGSGYDTFHYTFGENLDTVDYDYIDGGGWNDTLVLHLTPSEEAQYRSAIEEALLTHKPWLPFDFATVTDGHVKLKIKGIENIVFEVEGNEAPVAVDDNFSVDEDNQLIIDPAQLIANDNDPDGTIDPDSVVVMTAPEHGSISVNTVTGIITYTPYDNYNGPDSFIYTIEDNQGATSNEATVNINVNPINDAPAIEDQILHIDENLPVGSIIGTVIASDVDDQ